MHIYNSNKNTTESATEVESTEEAESATKAESATEKKEQTTQQKINAKIKELKKLGNIDKQIATMEAKIAKLKEEKKELEEKYSL